jgi:hypothetical protein
VALPANQASDQASDQEEPADEPQHTTCLVAAVVLLVVMAITVSAVALFFTVGPGRALLFGSPTPDVDMALLLALVV